MTDQDPPIPAAGLDHVAIAVPDLATAIELYQSRYGCEVSDIRTNEAQGVRMAYVHLSNARIELMEPIDDTSPIAKFLERNPAGGIHHLCLTTDDADQAAADATDSGIRVLGAGSTGSAGQKLFFVHPKDNLGTLVEIEETH